MAADGRDKKNSSGSERVAGSTSASGADSGIDSGAGTHSDSRSGSGADLSSDFGSAMGGNSRAVDTAVGVDKMNEPLPADAYDKGDDNVVSRDMRDSREDALNERSESSKV